MMPLQKRISVLLLGAVLALSIFSGCSTTSQPVVQDIDAPPIANPIESHDDILLPSDMKWNSSKSMAINTASFSGGIYTYSGRVEIKSLKDFIKGTMANNNWKIVGEVNYGKTMFAFVKPNKTCMVTISEGVGGALSSTIVELYVTVDLAATKGLNPFGEPVQ